MATTQLTHTWTLGVKNDSSATVVADQYIITGSREENVKNQVAAGATLEEDVTITKSAIVSFWIESDVAVTLKINDSTSPDQTISLAAKTAYAWNNGAFLNIGANPLTSATITKLFFVNAGASVANIKAGFLMS